MMMLQHIPPHFVAPQIPPPTASASPPPQPTAPDAKPPRDLDTHHPIIAHHLTHHRDHSPVEMRRPNSPVYLRKDPDDHYQPPHRPVPLPASATHFHRSPSHSPQRSSSPLPLPPPISDHRLVAHIDLLMHERHRLLMLKEEQREIEDEEQRQRHYYSAEMRADLEEQQYREREETREYAAREDDDAPLDLSLRSKFKRRDSCTDSDDSGGPGEDRGQGGAAYKKNLMKRYCK